MPLNEIENNLEHWIDTVYGTTTIPELEKLKADLIGKTGVLTSAFKFMSTLSVEDKKKYGEKLNKVKAKLEETIRLQKNKISEFEIRAKLEAESLDITLPIPDPVLGAAHIISSNIRHIRQYYSSRGFLVLDGPEVETEFYNFDALNIPSHHPARQSHDTFYLDEFPNTLLRTHTSTVQIRTLQKHGGPIRMISIGKVYRSDDLDATHSPMFHQIECLVVDRNPISISNLKSELEKLLEFFFETKVDIRFRPSYFPFTEPGMEVDCKYMKKDNKLVISKDGDKWLELGGAGIVHPNVYKHCGFNDQQLYGFAFGFGLERLIMLKTGIQDIRDLYSTDTRWLKR